MARGRKKKQYRKKFRGINLTTSAEAYSQLAVWTDAATNLNPAEFVFTTHGGGGSQNITLRELIDSAMGGVGGVGSGSMAAGRGDSNAFEAVWSNLQENWINASFKTVGIGIGFSVGKKLTRKPRAAANRLFKQLGVGDMVRV